MMPDNSRDDHADDPAPASPELDAREIVEQARASLAAQSKALLGRLVGALNRFATAAVDRGEHDYARWLREHELPRWVHVEDALLARMGDPAEINRMVGQAEAQIEERLSELKPAPPLVLGAPDFEKRQPEITRSNQQATTPHEPNVWDWLEATLAGCEAGGVRGELDRQQLDKTLRARFATWKGGQSRGTSDLESGGKQMGSRKTAGRANANARIIDLVAKKPEAKFWSARQLAVALGYKSASTVKETKAWKELATLRIARRAERRLSNAERGVGRKRRR